MKSICWVEVKPEGDDVDSLWLVIREAFREELTFMCGWWINVLDPDNGDINIFQVKRSSSWLYRACYGFTFHNISILMHLEFYFHFVKDILKFLVIDTNLQRMISYSTSLYFNAEDIFLFKENYCVQLSKGSFSLQLSQLWKWGRENRYENVQGRWLSPHIGKEIKSKGICVRGYTASHSISVHHMILLSSKSLHNKFKYICFYINFFFMPCTWYCNMFRKFIDIGYQKRLDVRIITKFDLYCILPFHLIVEKHKLGKSG